jgi:hypothetical protein
VNYFATLLIGEAHNSPMLDLSLSQKPTPFPKHKSTMQMHNACLYRTAHMAASLLPTFSIGGVLFSLLGTSVALARPYDLNRTHTSVLELSSFVTLERMDPTLPLILSFTLLPSLKFAFSSLSNSKPLSKP